MARIFPSDLSRIALSGGRQPELRTLEQLRRSLPDDYAVFHGVHWSREHAKWTQFGEVDFVVVNQSGAVLLIEQKSGALEETGRGLVKSYEDGEKNANDQIRRSLEKVREKFAWQHGRDPALHIDYLVYCPDHRVANLNAAALDARRIVDAAARDGLAGRIREVLGAGRDEGGGWRDRVLGFFRQTLDLVPDIHAHVDAQKSAFVRGAGGLAELLGRLELDPFRLRIKGTAGCGKSVVARSYFDRAVAAGQRPLLLCFNRSLAERLRARVALGGYVDTWNGFCAKFLEAIGEKVDFGAMRGNPDFWGEVQNRVVDAAIPDEWRFDALVVDEGQDFEQEWFEIAQMFLRKGAPILWLDDADQNIYRKTPVALDGFAAYRASINYRSPERIARFVHETLPYEFEPGNDLPGLGVGVRGYDDPGDQPKTVARIVGDLVRQGFAHDDVVVLTCRGVGNSVFSDLGKVGNLALRRFTGDYDLFGNQLLTEGRLTFDSVYRFKGQQAPAVVLVDVDPDPQRIERWERLLYCGMTRATVRLEVVAAEANAANRRLFECAGE